MRLLPQTFPHDRENRAAAEQSRAAAAGGSHPVCAVARSNRSATRSRYLPSPQVRCGRL